MMGTASRRLRDRAGLAPSVTIPLSLVVLLLLTACFDMRGPRGIESALRGLDGTEMRRVVGLSVSGGLVDHALRLAADETGFSFDEGSVDRVQLGIYELTRGAAPSLRDLDVAGLEPFVTVRDGAQQVRIFAEHASGRLRGLAIVAQDGSELVAMRVSGDLGPLASEAIESALGGRLPIGQASPSRMARR